MKVRGVVYCLAGGVPLLLGALGTGHWLAWWLAGIVLAMAFVPVALFGPRTGWGQLRAVAPVLLIVTSLCTWSEALLFVPAPQIQQHPFQALIGGSILYLLAAGVLALLAKLLHLSSDSPYVAQHRGSAASALLVAFCGVVYLVCYGVFGALTFTFFTAPYYPDAAKVVGKLGLWFPAIQFARGVLMTLAVVPILYSLRMRRWQTAVVSGAVIWIAGGLAPLLMPNPFLGTAQRVIHTFEIFTQNFPLGVVAALLLLRRETATVPAINARGSAAGQ